MPRTYSLQVGIMLAGECTTMCHVFPQGSPLHVILDAGQWSSPAFLQYLDTNKLDEELVLHAHCDESSDSD